MKTGLILVGASLVSLSGSTLWADDWPQWRGPKRNGMSMEAISTDWPTEGPQLLWLAPGATPTVNRNRVFTINKWGDVFCLDTVKGTIVWQCDLRQHNFKPNRWGFAGSPLIWQDLVILNAGDAGAALDRLTGRIVWSNG